MPKRPKGKIPLITKEEFFALLATYSVNAMQSQKLGAHKSYNEEIESLSRICANLITHYEETPQSIIQCMEEAMNNAFTIELQEIDYEIKHLFNKRKNTPLNTSFGEREIAQLTMQINDLEKRKTIAIKEIIQGVIYDSLDQTSRTKGIEMPINFNLLDYQIYQHLLL